MTQTFAKQVLYKLLTSMVLICLIAETRYTLTKAIIFDLGYTLLKPNDRRIAENIGTLDSTLWYVKNGKKAKSLLHDSVFHVLIGACGLNTQTDARDTDGSLLPACMCRWLDGTQTAESVLEEAKAYCACYDGFINSRHKRLTIRTLEWMFDPCAFALSMRPIRRAVKILEKCAQAVDQQGQPAHTLYILSNWDPASFKIVYNRRANQEIFKHFRPENIYVSGFLGDIKPNKSIFNHLLTHAQLDAADCIFIDDQLENIEAARALGITALHIKDQNFKAVRRQLKELGITA